jgi:hypothetical protein
VQLFEKPQPQREAARGGKRYRAGCTLYVVGCVRLARMIIDQQSFELGCSIAVLLHRSMIH